jgi:tRNA threonylcarbamoyladenosine modification (KEOPS) complex Cgi121 subunit
MELLLRLAADTQIGRVLERLGVREGTEEVGLCVFADERSLAVRISDDLARAVGGTEVDDDYLRREGRLARAIEFYGIEMAEIESIQARDKAEAILILILERIATLDLRR